MRHVIKGRFQRYKYALRYLIGSVLLFGFIFLIPKIGTESILGGAFAGKWGKFFEWPAMFCSVRIIFLGCGLCLLLVAFEEFMVVYKNKTLTTGLLLISIPLLIIVLSLGFFYLLKGLF